MWEHPCVALIFLGARAVCSLDACHRFPQHLLAVLPLLGRVADVVSSTCSGHWAGPPCSVVVIGLSGARFVP